MKKSTAIIILIIGILIISMCNFDEVKEAFELNIITTTIQSKLINKDNKYIKADLKIPQLTMGNKSIENNLNPGSLAPSANMISCASLNNG